MWHFNTICHFGLPMQHCYQLVAFESFNTVMMQHCQWLPFLIFLLQRWSSWYYHRWPVERTDTQKLQHFNILSIWEISNGIKINLWQKCKLLDFIIVYASSSLHFCWTHISHLEEFANNSCKMSSKWLVICVIISFTLWVRQFQLFWV